MNKHPDVAHWIEALSLVPHPEGGFYRETYRSAARIGERSVCTAIYFLVTRGSFSAFHRIRSDEVWHFHAGSPLDVVTLAPDGLRHDLMLGVDLARGARPQRVVPAGHWFGARLVDTSPPYALVSCTVAPGFDFADFELAERAELMAKFPDHHTIIGELTRT